MKIIDLRPIEPLPTNQEVGSSNLSGRANLQIQGQFTVRALNAGFSALNLVAAMSQSWPIRDAKGRWCPTAKP